MIKHSLRNLFFCFLAVTGLAACENNDITVDGGQMPETGRLDQVFAVLSSINYAEKEVVLEINKNSVTDGCYLKLTHPAAQAMSFTIVVDESLVETYNEANETELVALPKGYAVLSNNGIATLEAGKMESSRIEVTVNYDEHLKPGVYLLPLTVKETKGEAGVAEESRTLYYFVNVWQEFDKNKYELSDKEYVQIGYLDPEELNPLLINEIYLYVSDMFDPESYSWYDILFDIVNLQGAMVKYDKQGNIQLDIKQDLNYVLINRKKYIMPLQAQHHKVCLSITGGGQGVGFSNFTKEECSSIIYQIKKVVEMFNLDGVNILDRNNFYNISQKNLPSIKKLLSFMAELREALPERVITLAESEETPKEVDKTIDGIRLGDCVDYAWADEQNNAVNPWIDSSVYNPIAGLEKYQWGVAVTRLTSDNEERRRVDEKTEELAKEGVGKVFIHYLSKVKAGLETASTSLWKTGARINWPTDYTSDVWVFSEIKCPDDYLNIHSTKWLKDW